MIYDFIDNKGTFIVKNPQDYNLYFPLTNKEGTLLSSISPNLAGDIKKDNGHFLTPPASVEDLRSNLLCRRDFFIKTNKEIIRLSHPYNDTLEAGFLYQKITKKTETLDIEIINFIPYNMDVEVMRVKITNTKNKPVTIIPTSFIPLYGRAEKCLRDHRHVSSLLNRISLNQYGILLKPTMVFDEKGHKENKTIYFILGCEGHGIAPIGQFPTLDCFYGKGDLISPQAPQKDDPGFNKKLPSFDGKEVCAALRFKERKLEKGDTVHYTLIMGINTCPRDKQKITRLFNKLNSPQKVEACLKETKNYWSNYLSGLTFEFKDKNFDNWLLWVKLQPALRKLFGCSFLPHFDYGKGGRGWRDLWQDALTLLLTEPDKAEELILNSFKGVKTDGSNATIITKEGAFLSDRNRINRVWSDHGIWPYLTLRLYINRTGDLNILNKEAAYFKDHLFKRAKEIDSNFAQTDYFLRAKTKNIYRGTILEHILIQNLTSFFNVGDHNIVRLENADWNDGLDMAPQKGESVTFSFMYAHNLRDLVCFLEKLKEKTDKITVLKELRLLLDRVYKPIDYSNYKEKQIRLDQYLEKVKNISGEKTEIAIDDLITDLKEKSRHLFTWLKEKEWLKLGFFNGYYDNKGRQVEGRYEGRVRMMLPSQVFSIMSAGPEKEQIKKTWLSIKKYLWDKKLGGFRLNTNFGSIYMDMGRAFGFSYGDKENGAFFNHMAVMLGHSLYKAGFIKEGFEVIDSIYKMAVNSHSKIYPMIPEYFNNEGRGLYFYLTGSASWYIYTLLEEIMGIKFVLGNICLDPKLTDKNFFSRDIRIKFNLEGKEIKVSYIKENLKEKNYNIKKVVLEGEEIPASDNKYIIQREKIIKLKKKEVNIKVFI